MKNSLSLAIGVAVILMLAAVPLVGCVEEEEVSPATGLLSEATMARGVDNNSRPVDPTGVFSTDAEGFFCSFKITDAPPDTKIKAEWVYVGGEVEEQLGNNYTMEIMNAVAEGTCYTHVAMPLPPIPDYEWPRGDFKIILYVDDQEEVSVPFKVE